MKICCCVKLKTGSLIIGILELIFGLWGLYRIFEYYKIGSGDEGYLKVVDVILYLMMLAAAASLILGIRQVSYIFRF